MAHDSQIVRAKENLKLSYGGPANDKHQALTNGLKLYVRVIIKSEAWPPIHVVSHSFTKFNNLFLNSSLKLVFPTILLNL